MLTPAPRRTSICYYCDNCDLYILRGSSARNPLIICRECTSYAGIVDEKKFKESASTHKLKKLWEAVERKKRNKRVAEEYKLKPKDKPKPKPPSPYGPDFDD